MEHNYALELSLRIEYFIL